MWSTKPRQTEHVVFTVVLANGMILLEPFGHDSKELRSRNIPYSCYCHGVWHVAINGVDLSQLDKGMKPTANDLFRKIPGRSRWRETVQCWTTDPVLNEASVKIKLNVSVKSQVVPKYI